MPGEGNRSCPFLKSQRGGLLRIPLAGVGRYSESLFHSNNLSPSKPTEIRGKYLKNKKIKTIKGCGNFNRDRGISGLSVCGISLGSCVLHGLRFSSIVIWQDQTRPSSSRTARNTFMDILACLHSLFMSALMP